MAGGQSRAGARARLTSGQRFFFGADGLAALFFAPPGRFAGVFFSGFAAAVAPEARFAALAAGFVSSRATSREGRSAFGSDRSDAALAPAPAPPAERAWRLWASSACLISFSASSWV